MNKVIILPADRETLKKWDCFVLNHPNGWLTHHSTWADILSRCYKNIRPYRLVIKNTNSSEIVAGLSVFLVNSLFSGKRLIAAPMATFHDPLINSYNELNALLMAAADLLMKTGSRYLRIKAFHSKNLFENSNFSNIKFYLTHVLPLADNLQNIWHKFDRTCIKQNIKKAKKHEIKFRIVSDYNGLKTFFGLYSMTRRRLGLPSLPIDFFRAIFDIYVPTNNATFLLEEYNGIPIASLLVFIYKNKCSAETLGWDIRYKWLSPSILLFWEAIQLAYNSGCESFDFGRTALTNKGLINFKRRWGTEEIQMPVYTYSFDGKRKSFIRDGETESKIAHLIFRSLPPPVYRGLSHIFYRHYCE